MTNPHTPPLSPRPDTRTASTRSVRYQADAGRLLEYLAHRGLVATVPVSSPTPDQTTQAPSPRASRPVDCVLLESVDIATKVSRTTIAVLESSTRLTCQGRRVHIEALPYAPADGHHAIERLRGELAQFVTADPSHCNDAASSPVLDTLTLSFPAPDAGDGLEERERLTAPSPTDALRVLADTPVDHPHLPLEAGVVAFDYLATFETLPPVAPGTNTCPDYVFYDARIILVIDHPTQVATLVGASVDADDLSARLDELARAIDSFDPAQATPTPHGDGRPGHTDHTTSGEGSDAPGDTASEITAIHAIPTQSDEDYAATVSTMKEAIAAGDIYQVVPARGFTMPCPDAMAVYHRLRESNPSPYMFYLATPDFELLGASPESALLHSATTGEVAIRPIAGTRPRGLNQDGTINHELDTRLELELRTDAKEVAEHVMLVDLARNDVARVSIPGTREVRDLLRVDRYSRVMHLVSEVSGRLAPDLHPLDAFRASMTMGTLTGAPKLRAAELIRQAEGERRGSYGGSVGYLRGDGELDTCIVIRSAFVADGQALVQAGAGVVADSVPEKEAAETVHKASAVLHAIAQAQGAHLVIDTHAACGARLAQED